MWGCDSEPDRCVGRSACVELKSGLDVCAVISGLGMETSEATRVGRTLCFGVEAFGINGVCRNYASEYMCYLNMH